MTDKTMVSVPRELAWRLAHATGSKELHALLAAPAGDVRAVVDGPLTDEGTMLQVLEPQQQRLLPASFIQPHPPRHYGFLQPEREVPGYTIEQMKEYGAQCAAAFVRQTTNQ